MQFDGEVSGNESRKRRPKKDTSASRRQVNAWAYARSHPAEIEAQIRDNEAA